MKRTLRTSLLTAALVVAHYALSSNSLAADFSAVWDGGTGNWSDPLHWSTNPDYPNNNGTVTYDATISAGTATLESDITIQRFFFQGGNLNGAFALNLNEGLNWTYGLIDVSTIVNLATGSTSTIVQGGLSGTLNNSGSVSLSGVGDIIVTSTGVINNLAGATWNFQGAINAPVGLFGPPPPSAGQFNNAGNMIFSPNTSPGALTTDFLRTTFTNSGTVSLINMATVAVDNGGATGSFDLGTGTNLNLARYTLAAGATMTGAGTANVGTAVNVTGNATISSVLVNNGTLSVQSGATLTLNGTFTNNRTVLLSGGAITSTHTLDFAGDLRGFGTVNANVITRGIEPGSDANYAGSAGKLTINGSLTLQTNYPNPIALLDIGGLTRGTEYDSVDVSGSLVLDGRLELEMLNGFEFNLDSSQTFTLFTSSGLSGAFYNASNGSRLLTYDGKASFIINYGAGSAFDPNDVVLSDPEIVPEPATMLLFGGGALVLGFFRRRR